MTVNDFNRIYDNKKSKNEIIVEVVNFPLIGDKLKTYVKDQAWRNSAGLILIPVFGLNSSVPIQNIKFIEGLK